MNRYEASCLDRKVLLPGNQELNWKDEVIHIKAPFDYRTMLNLYQRIKRDLGIVDKAKRITAKDLETYRMVIDSGGVPSKGVVKFWKSLMNKWNEMYLDDKYTVWKGIQMRYKRLMDKQAAAHKKVVRKT